MKSTQSGYVVITGGAGFIGSSLCEYFLSQGYYVTAVDNLITGRIENLSSIIKDKKFQFLDLDVSKREIENENLNFLDQAGRIEGVLHFACPASPVDFERIPFTILEVDSIGTIKTVKLAQKHKARYVLASTSEVYGNPLIHPQNEDYWGNVNPTGPRACYDEAKRFAEAYVSTAAREKGQQSGEPFDLDIRIARIFNTYGPRMRLDDGRVVPEFVGQALSGQNLTVHGDGEQTRSFCYVDDLVEGIYRLYQSQERRPVNLGNPEELTILQFAKLIQELVQIKTGKKVGLQFLPARTDDPKQRCPDIARAKDVLGWEPKVKTVEGLRKTIEAFASSAYS